MNPADLIRILEDDAAAYEREADRCLAKEPSSYGSLKWLSQGTRAAATADGLRYAAKLARIHFGLPMAAGLDLTREEP